MAATYWIARYISEPLRNEPKNIGVIVSLNGATAFRFFGEREDGSLDQRKLRPLSHPAVYSQWREYWRKKAAAGDFNALTRAATTNYLVVPGGEVTDTGRDTAHDVCEFLYSLLVGDGPLAAYDWLEAEESETDLIQDIAGAFREAEVLLTGSQLFKRHPIVKEERVVGKHVVHMPSFSQKNGRLYVMEYIDLSQSKVNKTKERAGWMGYMFSDIREANPDCETYSLIRPEKSSGVNPIEYAKSVLSKESRVVNWTDEQERGAFLEERRRVAEAA